jgi:hypothetical protein
LLDKLKGSKDNEEIRQLQKELSNKEAIFKVEDTMNFSEG